MAILPVGIGPQEGGYQIERSLRFNSADSAYLSRTPASAGNRKTWTWSGWVKRGALGTNPRTLFSAGTDVSSPRGLIDFNDTNTIRFGFNDGTSWYIAETTAVFRDPSAWYHIVVKCDLTNATQSNRAAIYVNGVQQTTNSVSWPNADQVFNNNVFHGIGRNQSNGTYYGDGYLTEINFIDGSALDPTSFGEYNEDTGVWQPKAYTGSYGTNGFYLDFADNSSTTALGYDAAGSNDWTPNNFSVTAGAGNDSLVDTPTNYGTDTGAGGEVRGNYATLNPLAKGSNHTFSNGNLDVTGSGYSVNPTTVGASSGKWYAEFTVANGYGGNMIGIAKERITTPTTFTGNSGNTWGYVLDGSVYSQGSSAGSFTATSSGQVLQVAIDIDAGKIWWGINNTWQNSGDPSAGTNAIITGLTSGTYFFAVTVSDSSTINCNFGQRPFAYTAPSGFKALCTQNLPEPTVVDGSQYMDMVLYTAATSNGTYTHGDLAFRPDFTWIKNRDNVETHYLIDVLRGNTSVTDKFLTSAGTNAEGAINASGTTFSVTDTGYEFVEASIGTGELYFSGRTYVGWNWKANGAGVSNTDGTITSTVSANTTAGFSIVTYTGNGLSGQSVGHGLGIKPAFIIVKKRSTTGGWVCWHKGLTGGSEEDRYIYLESTGASGVTTDYWGTGGITSSTFGVWATGGDNNASGATFVSYVFAPVEGYSAFGSYVGNGSADGPMIFTGFRPAFVLIKRTDGSASWSIRDSGRNPSNVASLELRPDSSVAEYTDAGGGVDLISNGFKLRSTTGGNNVSGGTFIYAAFAENPFKYSLAR